MATRKLVMFGDIGDCLPQLTEMMTGWEIIHGAEAENPVHVQEAEVVYSWGGSLKPVEVLAQNNDLKWIQITSAGAEHMPQAEMAAKGVHLTTASGVHAYCISESIFGMILGRARKLFYLQKNQMNHVWEHAVPALEIHEKTMGIIGVGSIGQETARLAKAFRMKVLGYRRSGEADANVDTMYSGEHLCDMLAQCDFVVNTLPATPYTAGFIGVKEFAAMKNSAYYITIGRGKTTDGQALIDALNNKQIAWAGLDVVDPEPLPAESPLWDMDNVFIGGHNSGGSDRYAERSTGIFLDNMRDYLAGKDPGRNLVDYKLGY